MKSLLDILKEQDHENLCFGVTCGWNCVDCPLNKEETFQGELSFLVEAVKKSQLSN